MTPRCPFCLSLMEPAGPDKLEQHVGSIPAMRWACPGPCGRSVVQILRVTQPAGEPEQESPNVVPH